MFWRKKKEKGNNNNKKQKKKGLFKISQSEDLGQVLNSQIPYSESEVEELVVGWKERDIITWTESDVSSFFLQLGFQEVCGVVIEKEIEGEELLEAVVQKELLGLIKNKEKKKLLSVYFHHFLILHKLELPVRMTEVFDSMILRLFEQHNKDNLVNKIEPADLAHLIHSLTNREMLGNLYFGDDLLLGTVNMKKFNILVGKEENNSQFFGCFFHPMMVVFHCNASFAQVWWLENEEDESATFVDLFYPEKTDRNSVSQYGDGVDGKYALRYCEYELLETLTVTQEEGKVLNSLIKLIVRVNRSDTPIKAPEFVEKVAMKLTDYDPSKSGSLVDRLMPYCKSHLSNIPDEFLKGDVEGL